MGNRFSFQAMIIMLMMLKERRKEGGKEGEGGFIMRPNIYGAPPTNEEAAPDEMQACMHLPDHRGTDPIFRMLLSNRGSLKGGPQVV